MVITLKRKNMALYPRYVGVRMTWELQARLGVAAQRQKTSVSDSDLTDCRDEARWRRIRRCARRPLKRDRTWNNSVD